MRLDTVDLVSLVPFEDILCGVLKVKGEGVLLDQLEIASLEVYIFKKT